MSLSTEKGVVVVLFDYTYESETGTVCVKTGDEYILIDKTNDEWWHVRRQDDYESFYVPAQYVRLYDEEDSDISCPNTPYLDEKKDGVFSTSDDKEAPRPEPEGGDSEHNNNVYSGSKHKADLQREDSEPSYVNLDEFRSASNINNSGNTIYANVEFKQTESPSPPSLEEGTFQRHLVPYLPWDVYKETKTGRLFYHNRETDERTWKPPRKDKSLSGGNREQLIKSSPTKPAFPTDSEPSDKIPPEYEEAKEDGNVVYIHKKTSQKWYSKLDESGRRYFYTDGKEESFWELPSTGQQNGEVSEEPNFASNRRNVERMFKVKSLYEPHDGRQSTNVQERSSTLPPSFIFAGNHPSASASRVFPSQQSEASMLNSKVCFEEQLCGVLNKARIAEVGKKVNNFIRRNQRKEVKNWSSSYVVLHESNLVFYKDQKMAAQKSGLPYGKPEIIVNIQGAKIDFNPSKDFTSKKNVIMVTTSSGSQYLLQSDDEKQIHEWLFRLQMLTEEIKIDSPRCSKPAPFIRSASESDAFVHQDPKPTLTQMKNVQQNDAGHQSGLKPAPAQSKSLWSIRTKLLNLISRRPPQEDLIRRGILKHTVFGSSLHELCEREHSNVPKFVRLCVAAIENKGLDHDGLYRISGNQAEIQRLRFIVDKDEDYSFNNDQWDIHVLTGSLKLFFRELQEPLFPQALFELFKEAICKEKNKEKLQAFKDLISGLPKYNYSTTKFMMQHLRKVIEKSHENRMQTQNVAIVFGPTLMWTEGDPTNMAIQSIYQGKVVEYVLLEYEQLFR